MAGIVGIMGGTFNPVHNGHIAIAKAAHEQFNIPHILVMPSYSPAYKDNSNIVSARHMPVQCAYLTEPAASESSEVTTASNSIPLS